MLKKYKYLVAGIALILFVLPSIISASRLDNPITGRDCYGSELAPGVPIYLCMIQGTIDTMEASFLHYQEMHNYYTPQLKETDWTVGNIAPFQIKTFKVGTMTVTGSPSFTYSKNN